LYSSESWTRNVDKIFMYTLFYHPLSNIVYCSFYKTTDNRTDSKQIPNVKVYWYISVCRSLFEGTKRFASLVVGCCVVTKLQYCLKTNVLLEVESK